MLCVKNKTWFIESTRVRVIRHEFWWSTWYSQKEHLQRFASRGDCAAGNRFDKRIRHFVDTVVLTSSDIYTRKIHGCKTKLQPRTSSEDNEADLGTKYLERDRVKKCV